MSGSLPSYRSPQDVYARHLVSHRGYPLWTPEPESHLPDEYQSGGLKIGDVGVIVPGEGSFDALFNICLPPNHPLHGDYGVPDNFEPVTLRRMDISITQDAEDPDCVISTSSATLMEVNPVEGLSDYRFRLSSSEGALLILPQGASRHMLRNHQRFGQYASTHAPEWYRFARDVTGRSLANDSLYLITGFYKARSWSLASFQEVAGTGDFAAQFRLAHVEGGSVAGAYAWSTTRALDKRVGPRRYNGRDNQSVYIQGFKIAITDEALGKKRVQVAADFPSVRAQHEVFSNIIETPEEHDEIAASNQIIQAGSASEGKRYLRKRVSIQHIPQVSQPFHPSDRINQYLLEKERSATVAITHDSQWTTLLEHELLDPRAIADGDRLEKILSEKYDVVLQNSVVYLQEKGEIERKESTNLKHGMPTRIRRHEKYYLTNGDICFLVEGTLFRLHRYFFERDSNFFRAVLSDGAGSSSDRPILIHDVTSEEFAQFVWVWYNPDYSHSNQGKDAWITICRLATRWEFPQVIRLATSHLEKLHLPPIEKIVTYEKLGLDPKLLVPSYMALCKRPTLPSLDESVLLTMGKVLKIATTRERAFIRAIENGYKNPTITNVPDDVLRSIVEELLIATPQSDYGTIGPGDSRAFKASMKAPESPVDLVIRVPTKPL